MQTRTFVQRITSRKFILAVSLVVVGALIALGVDATTIETLIGAVVALFGALSLIFVEGNIDAKSITATIEAAKEVQEAVDDVVEEIKEENET